MLLKMYCVVTTEIYARINDAVKFEAISKLNSSTIESYGKFIIFYFSNYQS